jgi:hypothetical protein
MATNEDGAESGGAAARKVLWHGRGAQATSTPPPAPQRRCNCWLGTTATHGDSRVRERCPVHGDAAPQRTGGASDGQRLAEIAAREAGATDALRVLERCPEVTWSLNPEDGEDPRVVTAGDVADVIRALLARLVAAESARREAEGERHAADQRAEARYLDLSAENAAMRDALKLAEVPLRSAVSQSGHTLGCRCVDHWCALRERAMNAVAAALAPPAAPATETGTGTQQASAGEPERACHD